VTTDATMTWPASVPVGRPSVRFVTPLPELLDEPIRTMGAASGGGGGGASWQVVLPESVNVLPASGTNCQS
jgi:hypothetical protein